MALTLKIQPEALLHRGRKAWETPGERGRGRNTWEVGASGEGWGHLGKGILGEGAAPVHTVMQTLMEHWGGCGMRRIWPDQVLASILERKKMFYFIGSFKNSELKVTLKLKLNRIEIKIISE